MKKVLVFLLLIFCFITSVSAGTCSPQEKMKYMNEAVKVTASYEFLKDEFGRSYFLITVYNLSSNVSAIYTDRSGANQALVGNDDTITASFTDYNIDEAYTYTFEITISGDDGCLSRITTISLTKPKRNYYYDNIPECKYEKMKDYYYCKEWINNDFHISEDTIIKNIKNEFNKTTTSVSEESDVDDNLVTILQLYRKYRVYILGGLGLGILADIIYIFLSYKKIKEGEF